MDIQTEEKGREHIYGFESYKKKIHNYFPFSASPSASSLRRVQFPVRNKKNLENFLKDALLFYGTS